MTEAEDWLPSWMRHTDPIGTCRVDSEVHFKDLVRLAEAIESLARSVDALRTVLDEEGPCLTPLRPN